MVYCNLCGTDNADNMNFCHACGAALTKYSYQQNNQVDTWSTAPLVSHTSSSYNTPLRNGNYSSYQQPMQPMQPAPYGQQPAPYGQPTQYGQPQYQQPMQQTYQPAQPTEYTQPKHAQPINPTPAETVAAKNEEPVYESNNPTEKQNTENAANTANTEDINSAQLNTETVNQTTSFEASNEAENKNTESAKEINQNENSETVNSAIQNNLANQPVSNQTYQNPQQEAAASNPVAYYENMQPATTAQSYAQNQAYEAPYNSYDQPQYNVAPVQEYDPNAQAYQNYPQDAQQQYYPENQQYYDANANPNQEYAYTPEDYANQQEYALNNKKRKTKRNIIITVVVLLILISGSVGAYFALSNFVYSPKAVVTNYLNLLAQGKYTEATNKYNETQADKYKLTGIVTDEFAKDAKSHMYNPQVLSVKPYDCVVGTYYEYKYAKYLPGKFANKKTTCYNADVSYYVGGNLIKKKIVVRPNGTQMFMFTKYQVSPRSMTRLLRIRVPENSKVIKVNNNNLDLSTSSFSSSNNEYDVLAYPGIYNIVAQNKDGEEQSFTVDTEKRVSIYGYSVDTAGDDDDTDSDTDVDDSDDDTSSDDDSSSSDDDTNSDDSSSSDDTSSSDDN